MNWDKSITIAIRFFQWYCKESLQESILGDLEEQLEEDTLQYGASRAKRRFVWNVIRFFRLEIIQPFSKTQRLNNYGMFKNYFKVGVRNILKYKMFSFINVFGLAVAMSVFMLIILMLADQKSYDQFHTKKDRIYRVIGIPEIGTSVYATVPFPLADELRDHYPFIEKSTLLRRGVGGDITHDEKMVEVRGFFADEHFLDVFSFPFIKGDHKSALIEPQSIVLSADKAYQLFNTDNPIGKFVNFEDRGLNIMEAEGDKPPVDWGVFEVTGVVDMGDVKSHLKFDALISSATLPGLYRDTLIADLSNKWESYWSTYNYVLLRESVDQAQLDEELNMFSQDKFKKSEKIPEYRLSSQALTDITPGILVNNESTFRLPMIVYYFLSFLALIIMVMACLNYTNLSIARALTRLKEIGVRKVNGATSRNLIIQFLIESMITVFFALVVAFLILMFIKSGFKGLWVNEYLNYDLDFTGPTIILFIVFALFVGLVSGLYPSFYLSKKMPLMALKSDIGKTAKWGAKKMLNITQFVVSLLFIVTSLVIYNQFKHYTEFEYGFTSKNIVNIPLQSNDFEKMKRELSTVSGVLGVSACQYIPATGTTDVTHLIDTTRHGDTFELLHMRVSDDFVENFDLNILHGEGLPNRGELDGHMVINEAAATLLGYEYPQEAIGQIWDVRSDKSREIVGVVENFRATLLINGHEIRPMAMTNVPAKFSYLNVRIAGDRPSEVISRLETAWEKVDVRHPFKYEYFDEELANTNLVIFDIVRVIGYLAFLAIIIACLGLLGMAIYTSERRTKEVGIRKVLGATEQSLVLLLSKSFLTLLLISIIIAAPLSYFMNSLWLQDLPNRVDFSFVTVLWASLILFGLGVLTIGSQTIRASRKNPVESLKVE